MSISIIIPVYNEAECIERCLRETQAAFADIDHEIIVVNDGSTDSSDGIVTRMLNGDRRLAHISYRDNRGYSHAIRQGLAVARCEYVSYLDADLQYPPDQLRRMYDFALAERAAFVLGQPTRKYYNRYRRLQSFVYNGLVSRVLGLDVPDANALKLIRADTIRTLRLRGQRGAIELEVLVGVAARSIPIRLFPITVQERVAGRSKSGPALILPTLGTIAGLWRARSRRARKCVSAVESIERTGA